METLDEFDDEYPLSMSFCKLISLEDFEEQSLSYTEQCLQELVTNMEQSPGICERVMRKRKQVEKEEAGLVSFLKVPAVPSQRTVPCRLPRLREVRCIQAQELQLF